MRGGWTIRPPLIAFAGVSGPGRISTCCTASPSNVWRRNSAQRLAPKFGVPAQDDEGLNALARFWHELPAWPDVVGGLYRLKPRYMIAPLSNGHVALLVSMSKSLGLPWDMIFGADLFRHYKPDPETYLGAAALFGCAPGEVIMVASHPSDLAGAARYGLRTCLRVPEARIRRGPDRGARADARNFRADGRRRRRTGGVAGALSGAEIAAQGPSERRYVARKDA